MHTLLAQCSIWLISIDQMPAAINADRCRAQIQTGLAALSKLITDSQLEYFIKSTIHLVLMFLQLITFNFYLAFHFDKVKHLSVYVASVCYLNILVSIKCNEL